MTKERRGANRHRGSWAVLAAMVAMLSLVAALEFVPQSPFAGMVQRWIAGTRQTTGEVAYPGNPADDGTSDALRQWLDAEQPEVAVVEPPNFDPVEDGPDDDEQENDGTVDPEATEPAAPIQGGTSAGGASSTSSGNAGSSPSSSGTTSGNSGSGSGSSSGGNSSGSSSTTSGHKHTLATREVVETTDWIEYVDGHYETVHHAAV